MHSLVPGLFILPLIYFAYRRRSPFALFYSGLLGVFVLPHIYNSIAPNQVYPDHVYLQVSIQASLFMLVMLLSYGVIYIGRSGGVAVLPDPLQNEMVNYQNGRFALFFFSTSILLILWAFDFKLNFLVESNWQEFRSDASVLKLLGSYLLFLSSSFLLICVRQKSILGVAAIVLFTFFVAIGLKSRSYLLVLVLPLIGYYLLFAQWSVRRLLLLAFMFFALAAAYSFTRSVRHAGNVGELLLLGEIGLDTGEFQLVNTLYHFVNIGGPWDSVGFDSLLRLVLFAFPAAWLPFTKPRDMSHILWDEMTGLTGVSGSLHPTVIGEVVLSSYGLGFIVYGVLFPTVFVLLERAYVRMVRLRPALFSALCVVSLYWARGAFFNGSVILLFSLIVLFFIDRVMNRRCGKSEMVRQGTASLVV